MSRFVAPTARRTPISLRRRFHTHQHHVHDDDPADDHGYGAHQNEHSENAELMLRHRAM